MVPLLEGSTMNDEKISLRIEAEELQRIDDYLEKHPEAGSRSLFIKNCIREYLDRDAQVIEEVPRAGPNTVTFTLPGRYMASLERMVQEEFAVDNSDAARQLFMESMRQLLEAGRETAIDGGLRATPESR